MSNLNRGKTLGKCTEAYIENSKGRKFLHVKILPGADTRGIIQGVCIRILNAREITILAEGIAILMEKAKIPISTAILNTEKEGLLTLQLPKNIPPGKNSLEMFFRQDGRIPGAIIQIEER